MLDQETDALAKSDATVGICPITEAKLAAGIFPLKRYSRAGRQIAISSDSNTSINPFEEMPWLEYV